MLLKKCIHVFKKNIQKILKCHSPVKYLNMNTIYNGNMWQSFNKNFKNPMTYFETCWNTFQFIELKITFEAKTFYPINTHVELISRYRVLTVMVLNIFENYWNSLGVFGIKSIKLTFLKICDGGSVYKS
jgi:hypothetical protein